MNEGIQAPRFHGKNVVVIGASSGLGRAIVATASASGVRVLAVARSAEPLKQLAAEFPGTRILALDTTRGGRSRTGV
jgi:short-subunit dehydrogenase